MRITLSKKCFLTAMSKTSNIADKKSSMAILSNVLIAIQDDHSVKIATTDLNLSASGIFPAKVFEEGAITLPAKTVHEIVKSMPEGDILVATEGGSVKITSGKIEFEILGLPADDFPSIPEENDITFFEINTDIFAKMIEKTAFSISNDETRPHINGAFFQGDGKVLRMVTTDGHRLTKIELKVDQAGFYNFSMIIPVKAIHEIRRLLNDGDDVVKLGTKEGSLFFKKDITIEKAVDDEPEISAEFVFVSKLIEAEFPPYDQVIPKSLDKSIVIPKWELIEALKRVILISSDQSHGVKFSLSEGVMEVSSDNPSIGKGKTPIDVNYEWDDMNIGFNAKYFIEVLGVLEDDEINMDLSGELDPTVIKDNAGEFIGVVMPMRI
ncbi:MAG: DNA polymerase III subunit beta [Deltaproteobacteria bacterium]|nr:DNA polymerase III subunit beta [Deltaproteobacteria bacterium]